MIRFDDLIFFDRDNFSEPKTIIVKDKKFKWIGDSIEIPIHYSNADFSIDCKNLIAIPSFIDSHIHFLGLAAKLVGHQVSLQENQGLEYFRDQLIKIDQNDKRSDCLRIYGLDIFHPSADIFFTKDIFDSCVPDRPAILRFTSGHAVLLNSKAMSLLGITESTDEIEGATFVRSPDTGELTGVFYEIEALINKSLPPIPSETIFEGIKSANDLLLSNGFTSFMDATAENDLSRLNFLAKCVEENIIELDVSFMPGYENLEEFIQSNIRFGTNFEGIKIGPVKLLASFSGGSIHPKDLKDRVQHCHSLGFPVAIHAVEEEIVYEASEILSNSYLKGDRLEHVTELSDKALDILRQNEIYACVNPSFIYEYGDRYKRLLKSDKFNKIYRFRSMLEQNVVLGFGSDAPVSTPSGLQFLQSATIRTTKLNEEISISQKISIIEAIKMATVNNGLLNGISHSSTPISRSNPANMILVKNEDLLNIKTNVSNNVLLTMKNGEILYSAL